MKLIIDIPEGLKQKIDEGFINQVITDKLWYAAKNATPLPKGHGRLIDAERLYDDFESMDYDFEDAIEYAPTIIEADKEG